MEKVTESERDKVNWNLVTGPIILATIFALVANVIQLALSLLFSNMHDPKSPIFIKGSQPDDWGLMDSTYVYWIAGIVLFALYAWVVPRRLVENRVIIYAAASAGLYALLCYVLTLHVHLGGDSILVQLGAQPGSIIEAALNPLYMAVMVAFFMAIACGIARFHKIHLGKSAWIAGMVFLIVLPAISYYALASWHANLHAAFTVKQR
jgi:hypothetical protein